MSASPNQRRNPNTEVSFNVSSISYKSPLDHSSENYSSFFSDYTYSLSNQKQSGNSTLVLDNEQKQEEHEQEQDKKRSSSDSKISKYLLN